MKQDIEKVIGVSVWKSVKGSVYSSVWSSVSVSVRSSVYSSVWSSVSVSVKDTTQPLEITTEASIQKHEFK